MNLDSARSSISTAASMPGRERLVVPLSMIKVAKLHVPYHFMTRSRLSDTLFFSLKMHFLDPFTLFRTATCYFEKSLSSQEDFGMVPLSYLAVTDIAQHPTSM
jgi:hypothetical protein